MWYGFGGRLRNSYFPAESVVVVRVNQETGWAILTSTACITPPVGSLTVPWTVPAPPSSCAPVIVGAPRTANSMRARARSMTSPLRTARVDTPGYARTFTSREIDERSGARRRACGEVGGGTAGA